MAAVVVVHDEAETCEAMLSALREAGFDAVAFADPVDLLDAVQHERELLVLVTRMSFGEGRVNGLALFRMLEYKRVVLGIKEATLRAVFIGRSSYQEDAEREGIFLLRPADPRAVVAAVLKQLKPSGVAALRMATGAIIWEGARVPVAPMQPVAAIFSRRTDQLLRHARLAVSRATTIRQWRMTVRRPFEVR